MQEDQALMVIFKFKAILGRMKQYLKRELKKKKQEMSYGWYLEGRSRSIMRKLAQAARNLASQTNKKKEQIAPMRWFSR